MRSRIVLVLLVASIPSFIHAQGILGKIKNKVKAVTENRAEKRAEEATNKTLDDIEGKGKATDNNQPVAADKKEATQNTLVSFTKYDFIAGEKILYAEDLAQEAIGELPTGWNTNGSGEVVTLDGFTGNWLRVHNPFTYIASNKNGLTENYTAEFDIILQLKNNGWRYPTFSAGFFSTNGEPAGGNHFLKDQSRYAAVVATIFPEENNNSRVLVESFKNATSLFKSEPKIYGVLDKYYGKPVHVAIQVQKQRFRMWINETKVFDVPKGVDTSFKMNQVFFKVGNTNYKEEQYGIYISNIRVATGLPDTRHKLLEEGKFSTAGILFDKNSATIKPESYGVIKEIGTVLKENPSTRIRIVGHTSSDGDDKANIELSKKRAASVKQVLITEYGIDAAILETDGKGETQPVADNKTKEGQVQNRRVEFIKL